MRMEPDRMKPRRRPRRPPAASAKGERFTLLRRPPRAASASFAGGGASGRARHLLDSLLRLARDRKCVYLVLVLLILDQVRRIAAPVSGAAAAISSAYERANRGPVAHALEAAGALAPKGGRVARVVERMRGAAPAIDGVIRGVWAGTRMAGPFEVVAWVVAAVRK